MSEGKTPKHARPGEWTDGSQEEPTPQTEAMHGSHLRAPAHEPAAGPEPALDPEPAPNPTPSADPLDAELERFYRHTTMGITLGLAALAVVAGTALPLVHPTPVPTSQTPQQDDTAQMIQAEQASYRRERDEALEGQESDVIANGYGAHDAPTPEQNVAMQELAPQVQASGAQEGFESSDGFQELLYQVNAWHEAGHEVGFVLRDMATGAELDYNAEQVFYPASSIKGPYVCAVYQELVETDEVSEADVHELAQKAILYSDNKSYDLMHDKFGTPRGEKFFRDWAVSAGADTCGTKSPRDFVNYRYPLLSPSQLAAMWTKMYAYLDSGTEDANIAAGFFAARETSPIKTAVGDRYESWGKAGWFYDEEGYNSAPATADAGIVFAETGPYLVCVMSDAPGDLDGLAKVVAGLDAARADLV